MTLCRVRTEHAVFCSSRGTLTPGCVSLSARTRQVPRCSLAADTHVPTLFHRCSIHDRLHRLVVVPVRTRPQIPSAPRHPRAHLQLRGCGLRAFRPQDLRGGHELGQQLLDTEHVAEHVVPEARVGPYGRGAPKPHGRHAAGRHDRTSWVNGFSGCTWQGTWQVVRQYGRGEDGRSATWGGVVGRAAWAGPAATRVGTRGATSRIAAQPARCLVRIIGGNMRCHWANARAGHLGATCQSRTAGQGEEGRPADGRFGDRRGRRCGGNGRRELVCANIARVREGSRCGRCV